MTDAPVFIKCKNCGATFQPDVNTRGAWVCPSCQGKNPNLKRHYRSVADVCILGVVATVVLIVIRLNERGADQALILLAAHAALLLVTIVSVYKSKVPWTDKTAKALIWIVFGLAFTFNVLVPLFLAGVLNIPMLVIYVVISPYLFWLNSQAGKCTASGPPPVPDQGQS